MKLWQFLPESRDQGSAAVSVTGLTVGRPASVRRTEQSQVRHSFRYRTNVPTTKATPPTRRNRLYGISMLNSMMMPAAQLPYASRALRRSRRTTPQMIDTAVATMRTGTRTGAILYHADMNSANPQHAMKQAFSSISRIRCASLDHHRPLLHPRNIEFLIGKSL